MSALATTELAGCFDAAAWTADVHAAADACFKDESLTNPIWRPLADTLMAAGATDLAKLNLSAVDAMEAVLEPLVDLGYQVCRRKPKRVERLCVKYASGNTKADTPFKCISDLIAYKVLVRDASAIRAMAADIVERFKAAGGRAFTSTRYAPSLSDRVYVLMPGCAIAEIAVLHPFASHVFKHDSALRDVRDGITPEYLGEHGPVDYWANDVWNSVSNALMTGADLDAIEILLKHSLPIPIGMH